MDGVDIHSVAACSYAIVANTRTILFSFCRVGSTSARRDRKSSCNKGNVIVYLGAKPYHPPIHRRTMFEQKKQKMSVFSTKPQNQQTPASNVCVFQQLFKSSFNKNTACRGSHPIFLSLAVTIVMGYVFLKIQGHRTTCAILYVHHEITCV